jgi:hypothetical protein
MTSSASAATPLQPTSKPAISSPSLAELEKCVAGAIAGDDTRR